jgi:hypothetical protein
MLRDALLAIHITAGVLVMVAAFVAVFSKARTASHRVHVISGTAFTLGMGAIFVTAMPLAYLGSSLILAMVGVFSGYLALSGWRYARNRSGVPAAIDWFVVGLMLVVGIGMIVFGGVLLARGQGLGIVLLVFGAIASWLSGSDLRIFRDGGAKGRERIAQHLTMMLGGTIAALSAFSVNSLTRFMPEGLEFIAWLWPTFLITPMIVYWTRRVKSGHVGLT